MMSQWGLLLIVIGMFGFTQISETTSYPAIIAMLVVMGFGMGATMMPLFTSALKTLAAHEVARGSTLLNITQQVSSSVGIALISVVDAASSFAQTYWVAWVLVALTLIPALLLPRKREATHFLDDEGLPPVVVS